MRLVVFVAAILLSVPAIACETVRASWYGKESCVNPKNCRTANGDRYTGNDLTAAHRTLPFGTKLRVTYKGKSVVVKINDRGPSHKIKPRRDLDLSRAAAAQIGMIGAGVAKVCISRL